MWESYDQEKENAFSRSDEKVRMRCPMCKGRGFFDPTGNSGQSPMEDHNINETLKLPRLETKTDVRGPQKKRNKLSLPSIRNVKNLPEARLTEKESNALAKPVAMRIKDIGSSQETKFCSEQISKISKRNSDRRLRTSSSNAPSDVSSIESESDKQIIPSPRPLTNPSETLRSAMCKLKNNDWNSSADALREIVQIARFHATLLENSITVIYRSITNLLKGLRSTGVRVACQVVEELFTNIPNTQRPEFDELTSALLQKTADMNKFIRQDAKKALDSLAMHVPIIQSVRIIVQKGMAHKNPVVRTSAARMLCCIVQDVGVEAVFSGHKETRRRIICAAALAMQDGCQEVRNHGRCLMKTLMMHENFEEVLQSEVSATLLKRIDKALVTMKYQA